jgi:hypothetical protein
LLKRHDDDAVAGGIRQAANAHAPSGNTASTARRRIVPWANLTSRYRPVRTVAEIGEFDLLTPRNENIGAV